MASNDLNHLHHGHRLFERVVIRSNTRSFRTEIPAEAYRIRCPSIGASGFDHLISTESNPMRSVVAAVAGGDIRRRCGADLVLHIAPSTYAVVLTGEGGNMASPTTRLLSSRSPAQKRRDSRASRRKPSFTRSVQSWQSG